MLGLEALGLVFGGVSRLVQHWMELADKEKERAHEREMYDRQITLADKRHVQDVELRRMDGEAAERGAEWGGMLEALKAQAAEAMAAGGRVAKVSALIRPFLTIYHAVFMYTLAKVALFVIAYRANADWAAAFLSIYGDWDKALVGSMVGFWFQDRALRRGK